MHVELAHRDPVGEGRPLAVKACLGRQAEQAGALLSRVRVPEGEDSSIAHRSAVDGGDGDGGIVDETIADHLAYVVVELLIGSCHAGQSPSQLVLPWKDRTLGMRAYRETLHHDSGW